MIEIKAKGSKRRFMFEKPFGIFKIQKHVVPYYYF